LDQGAQEETDHSIRDVKLDNILVKSDGTIKLADFGASRPYSSLEARPMTPGMVTVWYRAPELLLGTYNYTPAVDIWAAGMVIGELLLNAPVLPGTDQDQLSRIVTLIGEPSPQDYDALERIGCEALATWYSDELQPGPGSPLGKRFYNNGGEVTVRYLRGFFDWNPRNRWTATEALGKLDDEFAMPTKAWWEAAPPAMPKERLGHILCGGVQDSRSFVLESRPKEEVDLEGKMKKHRMSSVKDGNPNVLDADGNGSDLRPIEKKKKQ
jgi:cyclin-dependent kinase 10